MNDFFVTTKSSVNIRIKPDLTSKVIAYCNKGERLKIVDVKFDSTGNKWYKIKKNHYISSKFCITDDHNIGVVKTRRYAEDDDNNKDVEVKQVEDDAEDIKNTSSKAGKLAEALSGNSEKNKEAKDLEFLNRRVFGTPFQFLPSTDLRPNKEGKIGRMYGLNILAEAPILSILPCKPNYLPGLGTEKKTTLTKVLLDKVSDAGGKIADAMRDQIVDNVETKYFTTDINYSEYIRYVNFLCRAAAIYMGIGDRNVPGSTKKYKEYNWWYWTHPNDNLDNERKKITEDEGIGKVVNGAATAISNAASGIKDAVDTSLEAVQRTVGLKSVDDLEKNDPDFLANIATDQFYVDFYVTPSTSYSDSFSNRTEDSQFSNMLNKGSDFLKELTFALGAGAIDAESLRDSIANVSEQTRIAMERLAGTKDNILSRLISDAQTIISGSNIIFPKIWHDSQRTQSYRAEIKLVTPYGDLESIYLNLLVPMFHIICFALPRQTSANSYGSPFIIKAHISKWFSCEMGMVDSFEIQKSGWNANGFPTELTISLGITDLYTALSISKADSLKSLYLAAINQSLLEYMSVLCGLDLKRSEWKTKLDLLTTLGEQVFLDIVDNLAVEYRQAATNAAANILGGFGKSGSGSV
jgi:hypothetical protein